MRLQLIGLLGGAALCAQAASAATITVNSGGDLQAALNAAKPGDTILLQAGATFVGNFTLPAKNGSSYITLRSSAPDSSLPAPGVRITPAYASLLPKIKVTPSGGTALITGVGASYWRLQFLEFLPGMTGAADLVGFGRTGSSQDTLAEVPHHLIMDRCYLHGSPTTGQRRGLTLNSGDTQIINSHFSDFKGINQDTQALGGSNGPGPYLIENNYIEAAAENIIFGGGDPSIPNLVPSNITIRRNLITKPLAWMSQSWVVKNLIEFKNAANVLVEGNTIENNWAAGQQGYSILFTPRNQSGGAPWSVVRNITVQNNVIRHVAAVFNISGYDDLHPSQQTHDIVITNNLIYDVSKAYTIPNHPANGWFGIIGGGPRNITIDHNTVDNDGTIIVSLGKGYAPTGWQIFGLRITNNLFRDNKYGIFGADSQPGIASWTLYAPDGVFQRNAIAGAPAATFPPGNDYPTIPHWLADFVSATAHDYRLVSTSTSNDTALDGTDLGVNFTTLNAAVAATGGVVDPPPDPGPVNPPPPPGGSTPYSGTPYACTGHGAIRELRCRRRRHRVPRHDVGKQRRTISLEQRRHRHGARHRRRLRHRLGARGRVVDLHRERDVGRYLRVGRPHRAERNRRNVPRRGGRSEPNGSDCRPEHRQLATVDDGDEDGRLVDSRHARRPCGHGCRRLRRIGRQLQLVHVVRSSGRLSASGSRVLIGRVGWTARTSSVW